MQDLSGAFSPRGRWICLAVTALGILALLQVASVSASTPPKHALTFDPVRGSIGGVRPGDRLTKLDAVLGAPDKRLNPGGGPVWLWLHTPSKLCTTWGEALADGAHRGRIGDLVYRGAILTSKGDRLGTPLRVVKRHWPRWKLVSVAGQGPNYGRITSWGSVAFGFDKQKRLTGVAVRGSTQYWQPIVATCGP
jgi:hypothetical protein